MNPLNVTQLLWAPWAFQLRSCSTEALRESKSGPFCFPRTVQYDEVISCLLNLASLPPAHLASHPHSLCTALTTPWCSLWDWGKGRQIFSWSKHLSFIFSLNKGLSWSIVVSHNGSCACASLTQYLWCTVVASGNVWLHKLLVHHLLFQCIGARCVVSLISAWIEIRSLVALCLKSGVLILTKQHSSSFPFLLYNFSSESPIQVFGISLCVCRPAECVSWRGQHAQQSCDILITQKEQI